MIMDVLASFSAPANWFVDWVRGWDWGDGRGDSRLTSRKALTYAPVWYGANKIAGHVAQLPIYVYRSLERGAKRDWNHEVYKLLRKPNAYQTSIVFREQVATHSLLDGNGRAAIVRRGTKPIELIPLLPDQTVTVMIDGVKVHGTRPSGDSRLRQFFEPIETDKDLFLLDDIDVVHIPGLSLDGVNGIALREIFGRNVGASIDAEKRLATQMKQGFSGNLMLQAPTGVFRNEKDAQEFLKAFEERHNSPDKAGKPGLLREGITANVVAMNNKDAEMIENRKFQRQDAALYLGLESILGDDASVSYNSLEQKNLAYLMNCLNRWLIRWEQEIECKLLSKREFESGSVYVKFDTSELLKSDFQNTVTSLNTLVTGTILSRNEAREIIDRNPVPGGDTYANPAITPGESVQVDQSQNAPPDVVKQARMAITSRLCLLVDGEMKKVSSAAKQASQKGFNFVAWLDDFYDNKWLHKMADTLEEVGMDRDEATAYCAESKRRILEVADYSTNETLPENVAKCVSNWKSRVNTIGDNHVFV